jgi:hypothetical protein
MRSFFDGIKNLIRWLPIIWEDRDWDNYFLLKIIEFKLRNMEKFFRTKGHHLYAERDAKKINTCRILCTRITKDNYYDNVFANFHKKWGRTKLDSKKIEGTDFLELLIDADLTEEQKLEKIKDRKHLWKEEDYLKKQDLDLLFKLMRKHIQYWWD